MDSVERPNEFTFTSDDSALDIVNQSTSNLNENIEILVDRIDI